MSNNNEATTGEIMEFLREHMVTKEDSENFATKEDLKGFATKEDLKGFATKEDIGRLREEILDGIDGKLFNLKGLLPNMLPAAIA